MGMTLWLHTRDGRNMSQHSDDHSYLYHFAEDLDSVCSALGKATLSSFFDTTDLEYNMADTFDDAEDDEEDFNEDAPEQTRPQDPETGLPYGLDDMQWFAATDGLDSLQALRAQVADGWNSDLEAEERNSLLEELDQCIEQLSTLPAGAKFHLAVIM